MTAALLALFIEPINLVGWQRMFMLLPLCLCVSLVYKAIKVSHPKQILLSSLILWVTIVVGMYAVGVGIWLLYHLMV